LGVMSLSKAEQQQYNRHLILDEIGALGQLKL
jgi:molybdopterin/thiamine biosynthesis adenylyltransferase